METKKSVVTSIDMNIGSFETQNGTFYKHMIYFENGDKGEYSAKTAVCQKFTKDIEAEYTIEPNGQYPDKVKPVQKQGWSGGGGKQPQNNKSFALAYSKDMMVAFISTEKVTDKDAKAIAQKAIEIAKEFENYLES